MSDVVEMLDIAEVVYTNNEMPKLADLMRDAISEITRLREALEEIRKLAKQLKISDKRLPENIRERFDYESPIEPELLSSTEADSCILQESEMTLLGPMP